jgi:hypothetical protein
MGRDFWRLMPSFSLQLAPAGGLDSLEEQIRKHRAEWSHDRAREWHALLERADAAHPVVIVMDDAHAASASTRALLASIANRPDVPLLVIVALRPEGGWRELLLGEATVSDTRA